MADIAVEATAITVEVVEAQGLAVDEPRVLVEHGGIVNITGGGGDGSGDVVGPNGVEAGRPARFADSSGKVIEAAPVNSPGGLVVLDGDATLPDILLPASIARDSEVTSAISAATAGMVIDTDPRLSDARTPLAHTHPATAVSTVPATTGLDPASTDVEKALTELASRPSGGGGGGIVVAAASRFVDGSPGQEPGSMLIPIIQGALSNLGISAGFAVAGRATHTGQTLSFLQFDINSTALTAGNTIEIGCYTEHDGFIGEALWIESIPVGAATGNISVGGLSLPLPDGPCWFCVANPAGNAGVVTIRSGPLAFNPFRFHIAALSMTPRLALSGGLPSDMSTTTIAPAASITDSQWVLNQVAAFPLLTGRV